MPQSEDHNDVYKKAVEAGDSASFNTRSDISIAERNTGKSDHQLGSESLMPRRRPLSVIGQRREQYPIYMAVVKDLKFDPLQRIQRRKSNEALTKVPILSRKPSSWLPIMQLQLGEQQTLGIQWAMQYMLDAYGVPNSGEEGKLTACHTFL